MKLPKFIGVKHVEFNKAELKQIVRGIKGTNPNRTHYWGGDIVPMYFVHYNFTDTKTIVSGNITKKLSGIMIAIGKSKDKKGKIQYNVTLHGRGTERYKGYRENTEVTDIGGGYNYDTDLKALLNETVAVINSWESLLR